MKNIAVAVPDWLRENVRDAIDMYDLHAVLPVPIRQFCREAGWDVRFRERMAPVHGWATIEDGRPVMGINASISATYQRYVMAHEIGHHMAGHLIPGEMACFTLALPADDERERIADGVAALLLIPGYALATPNDRAVAAECETPRRLVRIRRHFT